MLKNHHLWASFNIFYRLFNLFQTYVMNILSSFHIFSTCVKYISSFHPLICPSLRLGQHRWSGRWIFDYPVGGSWEPDQLDHEEEHLMQIPWFHGWKNKNGHEILWCKFHGSLELHIYDMFLKSWLMIKIRVLELITVNFFWTPSTKLEAIWDFSVDSTVEAKLWTFLRLKDWSLGWPI